LSESTVKNEVLRFEREYSCNEENLNWKIINREASKTLRVIFSENRESEDSREKSFFLLFRQKIPLSELIQGKIV